MKQQLETLLQQRVNQFVQNEKNPSGHAEEKIERKLGSLKKRDAEIVQVRASGNIISECKGYQETMVDYMVHFRFLIKQHDFFIDEEGTEYRTARFVGRELVEDQEKEQKSEIPDIVLGTERDLFDERLSYSYDRLKAVQYAERWWNEFNPAYRQFTDDCTNYISQCLHAGGIPMWGSSNKTKGWWMRGNNWSYSWTVAHSLMLLLANGKGIRTKEVASPMELQLGDIICYDFQGNGRYDHNTIVTAKDWSGMPLVNAHTTNSRRRYWAYEDSTAYTPNIEYKYFIILDGD
ncbi:amidase domain-containing protein [Bacillus sp. V5-8f]|uniref:amidase domain-containing protein n=1 Tax=Bacillus sp. V5-8f TaxID=2053044 RepID=UPI000C769B69|nr:amidase domain-containing protein [Bacillus sp. V5-8f]PLT33620.1 hypothetical protein CUU64_10845 [Bacillus sp. V5-8f]